MAAKVSYDETTNRESLSDMITNISPDETVIFSMIGKAKAKAVKHEHPEDVLAAPGANKHVEGASDQVTNAATNRARKENYCQIFKKRVEISETQETVDKAGVDSEIDYQLMLRMKEIGLDVEYAYVNNTAAVAGDGSTARELGGIQYVVHTDNVLANGGTTRFITETLLNDGMQKGWDNGGEPKDVVLSGSNKRRVSAFTAGAQKNVEAGSKKLVASVDVYDGDFGLTRFHASRLMPNTMIFGLDKKHLKTAYLRPFKRKPLPETNDSKDEVIKGELTLEGRAGKAHFIIKDLKVV